MDLQQSSTFKYPRTSETIMAVNPSNNPLNRDLRSENRSNIKSDFTLFPSSPLDNFLCQTSDPISSRLFSQPEPESFPMDTMATPGNGPTEKYKPYHLPSPLYSIIRDTEATSSPISDNLSYSCNTKFNTQPGQGGIQNSLPSNNLGRIRDIDPSQRIPYSPESLPSEYRYSTGQETLGRTPKVRATSPGQRLSDPPPSGVYGISDPTGSTPYFPAPFPLEKEPVSRSTSGNRLIPRNRYHPYSSYGSPSPSHPDGGRAASYDERMSQGNMPQRESPHSSFNSDSEYGHTSPPHQSRAHEDHREAMPPASQWPRNTWLSTSAPDLTAPQQPPTAPYHPSYPSYDSSGSAYRTQSYVPPYEQGVLQIQLRHGELETLSSNPLTNAIHCPHCTQKFPTTEQFTKHQQKHQKMYRCRFDNCTRTEGFATPNDRERHEKSVHKIPGFYWRCLDPNCSSYRKEFARRDNLKDHLKRMHTMPPGVDEAEANAWRSQMADNGKYEKPDSTMPGQ